MTQALYIETELGKEKRCPVCGEYWPLDEEFYYKRNKKLNLFNSPCRACYCEYKNARREKYTRKT